MKILVIGSGGREHAILQKLSLSDRKPELYAAPGNAGISKLAQCMPIAVEDLEGLLQFAMNEKIDLTIVGPEVPLVMGIVDLFESHQLKIFGPGKIASQFEGSKDFTKDFLMRHGIPTARYETHSVLSDAISALDRFDFPVVIKADGLAAGKGVIIAEHRDQAIDALEGIMNDKIFGVSGDRVVIEAFLKGIEASILCFVDGKTILPMQPAQDYKKAFDGDLGPNTGGMGTYSPSRIINSEDMARIQVEILDPFITGIKTDGIEFKGVLFVGLMIDGDEINVLEYNVRLGDPETEVTLIRLKTDLIDIMEAILAENLSQITLEWSEKHAVCVILASGGYPEHYEKGFPISGFNSSNVELGSLELSSFELDSLESCIFHCGTRFESGDVVTNGGRVLGVTALGDTLEEARKRAYSSVEKIEFSKSFYRKDIGLFS